MMSLAAQSKSVHDYKKKFINFTFKNGNKGFLNHIIKILEKRRIELTSEKTQGDEVYNVNFNKNSRFGKNIQSMYHYIYVTFYQSLFHIRICMTTQPIQFLEFHRLDIILSN